MKRTSVMVDEELLEKAQKIMGEKTYSATINKAMERIVRNTEFQAALDRMRSNGDSFAPGYVEMMWPEVAERLKRDPVSGDVKRAPKKKTAGRAAR